VKWLAALAAVGVAVLSPGLAAGQTATPPTGSLRVDTQTSWVTPPQPFDVTVAASSSLPPDQLVLYEAVYDAVRTRSEFALTLADVFARRPFYTATTPYDQVPAAANSSNDKLLHLPVNDPSGVGVSLSAPGVYPVQFQLRDLNGDVLAKVTTHLLDVNPASSETTRLRVSWVIPFHAPPTMQPNGSWKVDPATSSRLSTLVDALTADPSVASVPVVLQPTPETVDALAVSPAVEDRSTIATLASAVEPGSGREMVSGPYVPVNLPGLLGGGMGAEVDAQVQRGTTTLATNLAATPVTRTWVSQDPLDTTTLDNLVARGVTRVVVPEQSLVPINLTLTLTQPFQLATGSATMQAAQGDSALAAYFSDQRSVLAAHRLLADLDVLWNDKPQEPRSVVILTPRSWAPNAEMIQVILNGLATSPILQPVTLDGVFSVPAATSTGLSGVRGPLVRSLAITPASDAPPLPRTQVFITRVNINALQTVLPAGHPLIDSADRQLLVAEAAELTASQRDALLAGLARQIGNQTAQFRLPPNRTITLTARQARIPITVENDALFPAKLDLVVKSQNLQFGGSSSDTQRVALELTHKFTTEEFTVRTRTSGVFGMTVQLVAPNGTPISAVSHFTIRSTAASGVGIILSVGAALFLIVWWVRNARSGRRAKRLVPAADDEGE
jgi:hypothetical protein